MLNFRLFSGRYLSHVLYMVRKVLQIKFINNKPLVQTEAVNIFVTNPILLYLNIVNVGTENLYFKLLYSPGITITFQNKLQVNL